jgi:predicted  nucleic acid-binding Zn-ribbon protein
VTPSETSALAAELANLRGEFASFGRDLGDIKTSCAVLVERSNRTEQDVRDLRADMESELRDLRENEIRPLRTDVEEAKKNRWPLQAVSTLTGVAGAACGAIALLAR